MKLALVYDRVNKFGGAERILQQLHKLWPDAPLYTAVYNPASAPWAKNFDVRPSWLNRLPGARNYHEIYPWLTTLAFESFDFKDFDVVLSVTSAEAKSIITPPQTLHLTYCLTPTRYLWSHHEHYLAQKGLGWGLWAWSKYLRSLDLVSSSRPDEYLAISQTVAKRIIKYYQRKAQVIYPPVNTARFSREQKKFSQSPVPKNFYLLVGRLVSYKQAALAIKVFNRLSWPLVIVGHGREQGKLTALSGPTITWFERVSESDLVYLYQQAKALIMPQEEDLGLVAIEAQAAGTPVVALNRGGATETIVDGKTGILFNRSRVDSLLTAVKKSKSRRWDRKTIRAQAEKFDVKHFNRQITKFVEEQWLRHQRHLKLKS